MDLGYSALMTDERAIKEAIGVIEKRLDLVLITEHFYESMVLLRSTLGLSVEDVVFFVQNAVDSTLTEQRHEMDNATVSAINKWNNADYLQGLT